MCADEQNQGCGTHGLEVLGEWLQVLPSHALPVTADGGRLGVRDFSGALHFYPGVDVV